MLAFLLAALAQPSKLRIKIVRRQHQHYPLALGVRCTHDLLRDGGSVGLGHPISRQYRIVGLPGRARPHEFA